MPSDELLRREGYSIVSDFTILETSNLLINLACLHEAILDVGPGDPQRETTLTDTIAGVTVRAVVTYGQANEIKISLLRPRPLGTEKAIA